MVIKINVTNKRAALVGSPVIVCGNSGYTLEFTFDAEWSAESVRTARFVYVRDGSVQYQDVVFSGTTAQVPVLANVQEVRVGVFAGELRTSTPALIPCEKSIRCGTGAPEDPTPSQYDQIMALLSAGVVPHAAQHRAGGSDPLTAADVGARPNTWMPTAAEVGARPNTWMPTAAEVGAASNPNLIDNWYFVDPVNQRGQTEYYSGQKSKMYTIDRWYFDAWYRFAEFVDTGVYLATKSSESGEIEDAIYGTSMHQIIDNLAKYEGRKATLSAVINGELRSGTGTIGKNSITIPGAGTIGNAALSWDENLQAYKVSIYATTRNVIFEAVKLELGDRQTLAHQDASGSWMLNEIPDKGMELFRCQRYMILFGAWRRVRATRIEPDVVHFDVPVSQQMRITPSFVNNSGGGLIVSAINDSASFAADTVYVDDAGAGYIRLSVAKAGHGLTDAYLANNNGNAATVYFDANL